MLLVLAATAALVVANGPAAPFYFAALHGMLGPLSVAHWIGDGLMTLFFLLVGLEIRHAFAAGPAVRAGDRLLPVVAALAGMAMPALVYLAIAGGGGLARGWAIPAATDIAFAVAVLALLRPRIPASLRVLLVTIAVIDDLGAVLVIAIGYAQAIDGGALAAAAGTAAAMAVLARRGIASLSPYMLLGLLLWGLLYRSGVHATMAGVVTALLLPGAAADRVERGLRPWVDRAVVPLFGFAYAGVALAGAAFGTPLPWAVAAGLFLGKQAGVFLAIRAMVAAGFAARPADADWRMIWGLSLLCGIGFTMSLFIGELAFADPARAAAVKAGVLAGSLLSALAGYAVLSLATRKPA